jgi:signal transduction histidine kinase
MALDPDLPEILVDPGQASQILLNLVVNARDATVGQGKVRISTQLVDVGDERFVRLSVADDGVGMEADISEQIFEPFFSTKGEEGTGLGLSTIYGIATQHGGKVSVQSTPSVGSVFHVDLPPASRPADTSG